MWMHHNCVWELLTLGSSPFENGLWSWLPDRGSTGPIAIEGKERVKRRVESRNVLNVYFVYY